MASSLSISRASSVMGSILDRSIDIPRDISFRGDFTLVDRSGGSSSVLRERDLKKLTEVSDGEVLSNKALVVNSDKNITGVNEQTNTGKMKFDIVKNEDEGSLDLVFSRARGNTINKTETYHRNHIGVISYETYAHSNLGSQSSAPRTTSCAIADRPSPTSALACIPNKLSGSKFHSSS